MRQSTMQPLCFVSVVLVMLASSSHQLLVDENAAPLTEPTDLNDFLVYPIRPTNIRKREVASQGTHADHDAFVEEKLVQHSQALEHLLRVVTKSSSVIRRLMEHLSGNVEKPPMPEEIKFTRRSSDGKLEPESTTKHSSKSPWCTLSILCRRTLNPVCAFDDNFGYGRFYDICHMFQVNCYWNYTEWWATIGTCGFMKRITVVLEQVEHHQARCRFFRCEKLQAYQIRRDEHSIHRGPEVPLQILCMCVDV